ncbi:MAG: hypothetical protein IJY77_02110 [Alphaproteobacteria bacterium]|nr:hypothetical protein [Alphaproteobacteria bacterium]
MLYRFFRLRWFLGMGIVYRLRWNRYNILQNKMFRCYTFAHHYMGWMQDKTYRLFAFVQSVNMGIDHNRNSCMTYCYDTYLHQLPQQKLRAFPHNN